MDKKWHYLAVFLLIAVALFVLYRGFEKNHFFSDDFHWLSQAILVNDSAAELFSVQGRDFNPVLTALFWALLKIGGSSPALFRLLCFLTFCGALFLFFYLLVRCFKVNRLVAAGAVLLCGFNVYISEVILYLSTFVYALTLLLFFLAVKFWLDGKKLLFILFMLLAFQVKETIILALVPLLLYEQAWKERLFLVVSGLAVLLTRIVFQLGDTGSYTHFASTENLFYKLYFLILHPMNLSPFAVPPGVGIAALFLLMIVFFYFLRREREALFFAALFFTFVLFFAFLPKLSSKYYFYPCFAFWGLAALLGNRFYRQGRSRQYVRFMLFLLLAISLAFNCPAVKREIEDYRILGDFSKNFIEKQAERIKTGINLSSGAAELRIEKQGPAPLARTYREVYRRGNLLKLLPFRKNSIGGLIAPKNLVPFIFYPARVVRWQSIAETDSHFLGRCLTSSAGE